MPSAYHYGLYAKDGDGLASMADIVRLLAVMLLRREFT